MKKLLVLSLIIITLFSTLTGCGSIPQEQNSITSGNQYSEGLEFTLSKDGTGYSLTGIGSCTDTEIVIQDTYNNLPVTRIEADVFRNQASITSVVIPDSVTYIGYGVFADCASLTNIVIGNSVEYIGYHAFAACTSLTSITIPSSVSTIYHYVFVGCTSLKQVFFEDPTNWGIGDFCYNELNDTYVWRVTPIEDDFSNPSLAAQLLTSTYVNQILNKTR